jgi:hypothetical protein
MKTNLLNQDIQFFKLIKIITTNEINNVTNIALPNYIFQDLIHKKYDYRFVVAYKIRIFYICGH